MAGGLLLQMAGHAGSGKSTIAQGLARRTGAVVVDLDTVKSALLTAGVDWSTSSTASYEVIYALVDDLLSVEGARVVVDTPSYWAEIHARLTAIADRHEAVYAFVECIADEAARARRLDERMARRSQATGLGANPPDAPADLGELHHRRIERPTGRSCTVLRTDREVDLDHVLAGSGLGHLAQRGTPSEPM